MADSADGKGWGAHLADTRHPARGRDQPSSIQPFLHYAFDLWMARTHPDLPWCRYADDGLVHCRTEKEAEALRAELQARLGLCGLQMHPTKTQIVYCKDNRRRRTYPNVKFDFLGYQFRPRRVGNRTQEEYLLWLHSSGQSGGPEVHAGNDPELAHSAADAGDAG